MKSLEQKTGINTPLKFNFQHNLLACLPSPRCNKTPHEINWIFVNVSVPVISPFNGRNNRKKNKQTRIIKHYNIVKDTQSPFVGIEKRTKKSARTILHV